MHPQHMRLARSQMRGGQKRRGGFIGPLLGLAAPLLGSVLPGILDRVWPQKRGEGKCGGRRRKRRGGLAAPYGGKMKRKAGMMTPGPLA